MPNIAGKYYRGIPPAPCLECPLRAMRRVGGRGNPESKLVAVGEAPGQEEFKDLIPFVGPSGILFDQVIPPDFDQNEQLLVLNAMQCRPPKTKDKKLEQDYKHRCTAACRERLLGQIWEHPREVILCMGNWGALGVTGNEIKITQWRGEVREIQDPIRGNTVKVVYALHPAYLLRGGGNVGVFAADVRKAIELAYGRAVAYGMDDAFRRPSEWVDPQVDVITSSEDLRGLCDWIESQRRIVTITGDYETAGLDPFDPDFGYILSGGIYGDWGDDVARIFPWHAMQDSEYAVQYRRLRTLENVRWIWQGGKFDYKFERRDKLLALPGEELALDEDTLLLSYALDEASNNHDLDDQAKNTLGAPNHKDMLKPWLPTKNTSYAVVPEEVLYDYQAKDLKKQFMLWKHNRPIVGRDKHLEKLYTKTLIPSSKLYAEIELWGMYVDWDYVRIARHGPTEQDVEKGLVQPINVDKKGNLLPGELELRYELGLEPELEMYREHLSELAGYPINPASPQQVASYLYGECGLKLRGKIPTSTDKDILDKIWEETQHEAPKLVITYRRLQKMLSTYVGAVESRARDSVVHTTYKAHRTKTGRPSSTEPNVLNIPREARYRRMYRARPGYILIEADYNTAELRMLAVLSGDDFLMGVFLDDKRNLHDEVSIEMYGPDFTQDQRIRAKAVNFGIPYGRTKYSLAFEFNIPVEEAERLIRTWFERAPKAEAFINKCRMAALEGKSLITVFGRKRRPGVISRDRIQGLQNEFANFYHQSTVGDFTLHSAMEMNPELKLLGGHVINPIYDANLCEVPDEPKAIKAAVEVIQYKMETVPTKWIRTPIQFKVDLKIGHNWGMMSPYEKWLESTKGIKT
jgi:uracil-DNA glycosylase family 4